MDRYFSKFQPINYNGVACKDITTSSRLIDASRKQASLFYPIQIEAGLRADNIADAYYEDAEMDWLIWLTNDIIDPYYNWYLNEQEFDQFIEEKYGSYEDAVKKIEFYRNNWYDLDETVSPSFYDNNLVPTLKKYYTPVMGMTGKITEYKRREEDWMMNTNRIMYFTFSNTTPFSNGEIVDFKYNGEIVGGATVITSNSTTVYIQHVSGNVIANSTWTKQIIGETSNTIVTTNSSNTVQISISDDEAIYWEPVTAFDIEQELNESRKNVYIMNKDYALDVSEQLRLSLKE